MKNIVILVIILVVLATVAWMVYNRYITSDPMTSSSPLVTYSPFETSIKSQEIEIYLPSKDTKIVGTKFVIYGKGRGFENTLNYRISDSAGKQLYVGSFMTNSPEAGIFGYFDVEVDLNKILKTIPSIIRLDVYEASAKDGSDIHETSFQLNVDASSISAFVYFFNNNLEPEESCNKTFAVPRVVPKTQSVLKLALEELLKGPTSNEKKLGFETQITSEVRLNSVIIVGDTATVDLSKDQSGGSCRIGIVASQIANTAKQFSNVKNVTISVNGATEGILQP